MKELNTPVIVVGESSIYQFMKETDKVIRNASELEDIISYYTNVKNKTTIVLNGVSFLSLTEQTKLLKFVEEYGEVILLAHYDNLLPTIYSRARTVIKNVKPIITEDDKMTLESFQSILDADDTAQELLKQNPVIASLYNSFKNPNKVKFISFFLS